MEHLEVVIFDEIDDYSEKIKGLTFRQWIFFALAIIVVVPTYLLIPKYTPLTKDIVSYIVILEAAIIGLFGFIKIQNLNAEQIVPFWYRHFMIYKKPIEYITDNEWEKAHEKKNKKSKANKSQNAVGSPGINESNHTDIPADAKQENEVKNSQKQLEQSVVNEGKPQLTKKELKKKQKQEKMLKKAQAKYGYMFSDENGNKSNNQSELTQEPVEEDELIMHEAPVEPKEEIKEEQVTEVAENLTNVEDNKIDDVFNSLSPEERKKLLKKLVNNE